MGLLEEISRGSSKKFLIVLEKLSQRQLNEEHIKAQLGRVKQAVSRNRQRRFKGKVNEVSQPVVVDHCGQKLYRYTAKLFVQKEGETRSEERLLEQFDDCRKVVESVARQDGWYIQSEDISGMAGEGNQTLLEATQKQLKQFRQNLDIQIPDLTDDLRKTYLSHLFERDSQIAIIHNSVLTSVRTKFNKRRHGVLYGPPGCAKSELLTALKNLYGGDKAVLEIDATTCSKAGLEKLLLRLATEAELPPILFIEEIEKQNPETLHCLLQIMDDRGRIERTLATTGKVSAQAKLLVWGTCNDEKLLKSFMRGALWSRFCHRVYCPRPTSKLMKKILGREVREMSGKEEWIGPALSFCFDELKTNDPRVACALLDGGDGLTDGTYLEHWRHILQAKLDDKPMENDKVFEEILGE
jgi:energy-coupling factor transporter ATP-binding protein EcfA2